MSDGDAADTPEAAAAEAPTETAEAPTTTTETADTPEATDAAATIETPPTTTEAANAAATPKTTTTNNTRTELLHAISEQLLFNTRRVLPLLITVHSNDAALTRNALEHLYHFLVCSPTFVTDVANDPFLEVILACICDSGLPSIDAYATELINLVLKVVGSFATIPQACMFWVMQIVCHLQCRLFALNDRGLGTAQLGDQLSKAVKSFFSLVEERAQDVQQAARESAALTKRMTDFGSMLEGAGNVRVDDMAEDMIAVAKHLSDGLAQQNFALVLLAEIVLLRKQGRVGVWGWCDR